MKDLMDAGSQALLAGAFTLLGAAISFISVWWAQRTTLHEAARGAGRALAVEMLNNAHALTAFAMTVANNPHVVPGPNIFPKLTRSIFDEYLPSLARVLRFDELRKVTRPYTAGYNPYSMLEAVVLAKREPLDSKSLDVIQSAAQMFIDGFDVLGRSLLTKREREQFENEGLS